MSEDLQKIKDSLIKLYSKIKSKISTKNDLVNFEY